MVPAVLKYLYISIVEYGTKKHVDTTTLEYRGIWRGTCLWQGQTETVGWQTEDWEQGNRTKAGEGMSFEGHGAAVALVHLPRVQSGCKSADCTKLSIPTTLADIIYCNIH